MMKGIYLVEKHARMVAEKEKDLIVSSQAVPQGFADTELVLVGGKQAFGTITITKTRGPLGAETIRERLRERHKITDEEWREWWPENEKVYVLEFKFEKLFDEPVPVEVPEGVQKWIEDVEIVIPAKKEMITPVQVENILRDPDIVKNWARTDLLDAHQYFHMWSADNWRTKPSDLTNADVKRSHGIVVSEMKDRGYEHETPMSAELARHARDQCMSCNKPPTVEILWAEGKGHAWFCDVHLEEWKKESPGWHDVDVKRELPYGVASENWKDGPPTKEEAEKYKQQRSYQSAEDIAAEVGKESPYAIVHPSGGKLEEPIKLEEVLGAWEKPIILKLGYIMLIGGLVNHGQSSNDLEVFVKDVRWHTDIHQPILFRLGRALPRGLGEYLNLHFAGEYGGTFTNHVQVYDLVLVPSQDRRLQRMEAPIVTTEKGAQDLDGSGRAVVLSTGEQPLDRRIHDKEKEVVRMKILSMKKRLLERLLGETGWKESKETYMEKKEKLLDKLLEEGDEEC